VWLRMPICTRDARLLLSTSTNSAEFECALHCTKLVANKANSELLDFVLAAEVWQGLHKDQDCWAKELLEALRLVDPSKDWLTHSS
jgi:hypothetical protein